MFMHNKTYGHFYNNYRFLCRRFILFIMFSLLLPFALLVFYLELRIFSCTVTTVVPLNRRSFLGVYFDTPPMKPFLTVVTCSTTIEKYMYGSQFEMVPISWRQDYTAVGIMLSINRTLRDFKQRYVPSIQTHYVCQFGFRHTK